MRRYILALLLLGGTTPGLAQTPAEDQALQHSVAQLRGAIGRWAVTTDFLKPDGSVAKSVTGSYEFSWVVPDRVASGRSEIPELHQVSGLLFYLTEAKGQIEMVSVGRDGNLWIMTGPMGGEERLSQEYPAAGGGIGRLRFTRFNVTADRFESRMEYTEDGGKQWSPGNHQVFRRAAAVRP